MDNFIPLESIHIANPCSADWGKMQGDDRARFCASCEKHVYNLSDMTRAEAEKLVNDKEGRLCVQFYQRADGTMLTDNCPIPLRPARNGVRWMWRGIGAGVAAFAALFSGFAIRDASAKSRAVRGAPRISPPTRTAGGMETHPAKKKAAKKKLPSPIALTGIIVPPPQKTKPVKPRAIPIHHPGGVAVMGEPAPGKTLGSPAPLRGEIEVVRGDIAPPR